MAKKPYNGYTPAERSAKSSARRAGLAPMRSWSGVCSMCGDSKVPVKGHSEDYSTPYRWHEPELYVVCKSCHTRIHSRFRHPDAWRAYLEFLRRGWYGREVTSGMLARRRRLGERYEWPASQRVNRRAEEDAWWERLTLDPASLTSRSSRPRP